LSAARKFAAECIRIGFNMRKIAPSLQRRSWVGQKHVCLYLEILKRKNGDSIAYGIVLFRNIAMAISASERIS